LSRKFGKQLQIFFNNFKSTNQKKSETSDKMRPPIRNRKPPARGVSAAKAPRLLKGRNPNPPVQSYQVLQVQDNFKQKAT
jgi:hypothetical protein